MADPNQLANVQAQMSYGQHGTVQVQQGMNPYGQVAQFQAAPQQVSYHHQQQQAQQAAHLKNFWAQQQQEVENVSTDPSEFKNHQLPLARIKKIMKSDEDVRMISAEAPVLFAKACDMFILELTLRSWIHSEENKRRTLQRNDIAAAITKTDIFDFLVDIVPRDERAEGDVSQPAVAGVAGVQQPVHTMQTAAMPMPYYLQPGQGMMPAGSTSMDPSMMYGGAQFMAAARLPQQWQPMQQPPTE